MRWLTKPALLLSAALTVGLLSVSWVANSLASAAESVGGLTSGSPSPSLSATSQPERFGTLDRRNSVAPRNDFDRLAAVAKREGKVQVIVGLRTSFTPEGALSADAAATQRAGIVDARGKLLRSLAGSGHSVVHTYRTVPYVALRLSRAGLGALQASGAVASIQEDKPVPPLLADSTKTVEATESATVARVGAGQHVAILDTGVAKAHPFLQQATGGPSKVVSEACYSQNSNCPNGSTTQTTSGAGAPCTYAPEGCEHGTHVAGIAAGRGTGFSGVASGAKLISVQVFSRETGAEKCPPPSEDPCTLSYPSDQLKGLERVFALQTSLSVASVNMSIGGGVVASDCDDDALKPAIDNLRSAGIATVIASGNDSSAAGVSTPSCISSAITVGSTTKSPETISPFSNSSPLVELLAPGSAINSSIPGGVFEVKSGTSMATPHVAGAWAVMKGVSPAAPVATVLSHLQLTGRRITDSRNNVTRPRIRVLSAGVRARDTGFQSFTSSTDAGADVASNGVGLATRAGGPSSGTIPIFGVPRGATITAAYLYWMTIGGPDDKADFQGVSRDGVLVGASRDTCWNVNRLGPNRTYRATLPVGDVSVGNGLYTVSGVGSPPASQGQGASLVLVYKRAGQPTGTVVLRDGAMTLLADGATMGHTFSGLSVPSTPTRVNLHVGMADGQEPPENPMRLGSAAVTPASFFDGSDEPMWDDERITVSPSLLPAGTTSIVNSIGLPASGQNDCLAWPYAALSYG